MQATACDIYGNCATVAKNVSTANVVSAAAGTAIPVLIWPPAGSTIALGNAVNIQMAAASGTPLKEMGVMVNGQAAEMVNFTQQENVTRVNKAVTFHMPAAGEGVYNLSVRTTAWDGTVSEGPVSSITLDGQDPSGALITQVINEADAYSAQSGLVRFTGTAGDSLGNNNVATVQLSVNGGPFVDATWEGNGNWFTRAYVGANPYGKSYPVTMRSIDKAGRVMTDTQQVQINIAPPPGFNPARIPTISVGDVTIDENAGTASFVIALSSTPSSTVAIHYTTSDGSANAGDYTAQHGLAFICAGQRSTTVAVPINDDIEKEANEGFTIQLSGPVNATLGDGQGAATITDNDANQPPTATPTATPVGGLPRRRQPHR